MVLHREFFFIPGFLLSLFREVVSQFLDDAVAKQDGAAVFDAEFDGQVFGGVAFGHEVEGLSFVGREEGGEGIEGVVQVTVVRLAEGVGHVVVEREETVCAATVAEVGEDAAAMPDDPGGLMKCVGADA